MKKILSRKSIIIVSLCLIAIFILLANTRLESKTNDKDMEKLWPVKATSLSLKTITPELRLNGVVTSLYNAKLVAKIEADVEKLLVKEGDIVAKGQKLILLDEQQLRLRLSEKEAIVEELQARINIEKENFSQSKTALKQRKKLYELSRTEMKRFQSLRNEKFAAQVQVDNAERDLVQQKINLDMQQTEVRNYPFRLQQLAAQLQQAQSHVELTQMDIERSQLTAPFPARITRIHTSLGERVNPNDPLIELYALDQIEIHAQIPEKELYSVSQAISQQQTLSAAATIGQTVVPLRLQRLSGEIKNGAGGQQAIFTLLPGSEEQFVDLLILGKTISLTLELPEIKNVYRLPWSALYGLKKIYRIQEQRLQQQDIVVLGDSYEDGEPSVIIANTNIAPETLVLTTQLPNAIDGLKVKVITE